MASCESSQIEHRDCKRPYLSRYRSILIGSLSKALNTYRTHKVPLKSPRIITRSWSI